MSLNTPLPSGGRLSVRPSAVRALDPARLGPFLAEVGVGVVHLARPAGEPPPPASAVALHRAVKARFDPAGRLNPGRVVP